jgi:general stress protein YciG
MCKVECSDSFQCAQQVRRLRGVLPPKSPCLRADSAVGSEKVVAHRLILSLAVVTAVGKSSRVLTEVPKDDHPPQGPPNRDEPARTPDTPTDEPKPAPVQDPPAEPGRPPLVVGSQDGSHIESAAMNEAAKGRIVNGERKERRGFASMSPEKQREIASKGGRAAHQKGTAHEWTSEEARSAGRKGGQISRGGRGRLVEGSSVVSQSQMGPVMDRPEEISGQ